MTNKLQSFTDRFDSYGYTSTKWYGLPRASISVASGRLAITAADDYPSVISDVPYDMLGSFFHVEIVQTLNEGNGTTSAEIGVRVGLDNGNKIIFTLAGSSTLYMTEKVANVNNDTSLAYDPVLHRWLRVREAAGTIYWETSADSSTWTVRRSKVKNPALPSLASVQCQLGAGYYGTEPDPGTVIYDNVNQWLVPAKERGWTAGRHAMGAIDGGTLFYRNFCEDADWLWNPIPPSPVLDPNSVAMINDLAGPNSGGGVGVPAYGGVSTHAFGVTLITPEMILPGTPRYTLTFEYLVEYGGGVDPFEGYTVPIPLGTVVPQGIPGPGGAPDPNFDGHVTIADPVQGKIFALWRAVYDAGTDTWSARWGGITDYHGDGIEILPSTSTATCLTRYAAVLRVQELQAREIPHALFMTTNTGTPGNVFRYPAIKSDGSNSAGVSNTIPEGARLQLDPSIDVNALSGITPAEIAIARALQKYGCYIGDKNDNTGRSSFGFIAELQSDGDPGQAYIDVGLPYDFMDLLHIPWGSMRVLKNWDGSA